MIKKLLYSTIAASGMLFSMGQAEAADLTLDNFDFGFQSLQLDTPGTTSSAESAAGILGGERELQLTLLETGSPGNLGANTVVTNLGDGQFSLSNDSTVISSALLTYDGTGSTGLNTDFSGQTGFQLDVISIDLETNLDFTLTDASGNSSSLAKDNLRAGEVVFDFDNFSGNANLSNIEAVTLEITGPRAFDVELDIIESPMAVTEPGPEPGPGATTPEPTVILGLGLVAGAGWLRKKRGISQI